MARRPSGGKCSHDSNASARSAFTSYMLDASSSASCSGVTSTVPSSPGVPAGAPGGGSPLSQEKKASRCSAATGARTRASSISSSAQPAERPSASRARSASSDAPSSGSWSRASQSAMAQASSSPSSGWTRASTRSRSRQRSASTRRNPATSWKRGPSALAPGTGRSSTGTSWPSRPSDAASAETSPSSRRRKVASSAMASSWTYSTAPVAGRGAVVRGSSSTTGSREALLALHDYLLLDRAHGDRSGRRRRPRGDGRALLLGLLHLGPDHGARGGSRRGTCGGSRRGTGERRARGGDRTRHGRAGRALATHVHLAHVDATAEAGAVDDDDAGSVDVADHPPFAGDLDALGGRHVADDHARDHAVADLDLGLDDAGRLHGERLGERHGALDASADRQVLVAREASVDEDRFADGAAVEGRHGLLAPPFLDVHVDVALEDGAVGDEDARRADVADHLAVRLQLDLVARADVPGHLTRDLDVRGLDVGLDHARALDEEALLQADLALHRALDHQVLVTGDLSVDDDGAADHRLCAASRRRNLFDRCHLDVLRELHFHLDVALEPRAVLDDDAGGLDVSNHRRGRGDGDAIPRGDVAVHLAVDHEVRQLDVGEYATTLLDGQLVLERDGALELALHDDVAGARQVSSNHRAAPDDAAGVSHFFLPR